MRTKRDRTTLSGRYLLVEELGRGGIGVLWRAVDRVLDRPIAIKVPHAELARDQGFIEGLAQAAGAAARLSHPGIVRLLDTGTFEGCPFIVTEWVDGESLRALLAREGPIEPDQAVSLIRRVLEILAATHLEGVLHLNLKPENVLIGEDSRVRLTDTGLAAGVYAVREGVEAAAMLGFLSYAPPEQLRREALDERADVYAAAAILYESLVGRPPGSHNPGLQVAAIAPNGERPAASVGLASAKPMRLRAVRPGIPRSIERAVARALSPTKEQRFTDAEAFATALPSTREEAPEPARRNAPTGQGGADGRAPRSDSSIFRSFMLVPLILLLAVASLIVAGLWFGRLQIGGPLGIEPKLAPSSSPSPGPGALPIRTVSAYDPPPGDGHENDQGVGLTADGNAETVWRSENYFDGRLNKPGVGLLFDLGTERVVTGIRLLTPAPGFLFQVLVEDDPSVVPGAPGTQYTATQDLRVTISPQHGRYVLLWITTVVPVEDGAHRAEVGEVKVLGFGG